MCININRVFGHISTRVRVFLGNNSVKAVTWHGDLIAAATLGAVYLSDGSKRDSLNGLNGIQPYRMASRLGALYVATEYGIHVF